MTAESSRDRAVFARSVVCVLLILVAAGWPAAGTPFRGDQALFALESRDLAHGAVLYRDVWDVTNPGIYVFYTLAGSCFGFSEDGIHFFEWLYWVAFVGVVSEVVRREYGLDRWPLAPAILVSIVYFWPSCSDPSQLTKVEGLVGFPLFVAIRAASRFRTRWAFVAGVAGGIVVLFKFVFAACLAVGWMYLLIAWIRRYGMRSALWGTLSVLGGLALILGVAFGYFAAHGAVGLAYETIFVDSRQMLAEADEAGFDRLAGTSRWGFELYTVAGATAILGALKKLRRGADPFVPAYAGVMLASTVVVLVQRWSWWNYHVVLVGTPATVLAAYTWPAIWDRICRHTTHAERLVLVPCALLLFLPVIGHGGNAYYRLLKHGGGITAASRASARMSAGQAYHEAREIADWLDGPTAPDGPVFVCGDPLVYWLGGREPHVPISGWSMELYHRGLRERLTRQLQAAKPRAIFVAAAPHNYDRLIENRYPELHTLLRTEYTPAETSARGIWYARRP